MEFLGPEYDSECDEGRARHFLICTTPRTGGHALCRTLERHGIGVPMEYFNPDFMIPLQKRWLGVEARNYTSARENLGAYGRALEVRRARNTVLGVKVFPSQFKLYSEAFAASKLDVEYVFLSRANKVAQTISFAATLITRKAFDNDISLNFIPRIGELNEAKMLQILAWIRDQEKYWESYFSHIAAERVLRLQTENFFAEPLDTVELLKAKLGLESAGSVAQGRGGLPGSSYQQDSDIKADIDQQFRSVLEDAVKATF